LIAKKLKHEFLPFQGELFVSLPKFGFCSSLLYIYMYMYIHREYPNLYYIIITIITSFTIITMIMMMIIIIYIHSNPIWLICGL
jgi:hypothetical protein